MRSHADAGTLLNAILALTLLLPDGSYLRRSLTLSPSESQIFKIVSQEVGPFFFILTGNVLANSSADRIRTSIYDNHSGSIKITVCHSGSVKYTMSQTASASN
jgi:hypothetical protein